MRSPDQIGITWEENQSLMMQLKEKQALENRRKNKIYEVMDRVCLTINIHDESIHDDVLYVTSVCRFGQWIAVNHLYEFSPDKVRHATDAEIEAGKRLEVV